MKGNAYTLEFRGILLGIVTEKDSDAPNLWGKVSPIHADDHREIRDRIEQYRQHSIEADRLVDAGCPEWDEFVSEDSSQYADLIECNDWCLVDSSGEKHGILIPNFTQRNGVVWRWKPDA